MEIRMIDRYTFFFLKQRAYKEYRARRRCYDVQQLVTTQTMVAEAVVDTVHRKIFEKITSRPDIPTEYGTREEMMATSTQLQITFKEHMRMSRLIKESTAFNIYDTYTILIRDT